MNNHPPGGRGGYIPPFMARGGVGRPPMPPMHGGYGPRPGAPYMHHPHPRVPPMHHGGPPPYGGGYDYGADYGVPPGHNPPAPRMRMPGGRPPAPAPSVPPTASPVEKPLAIPPKPPSTAASDFSSSSKVESIVSEIDDSNHNNCEIIILERTQEVEKYADSVEKAIREIGLTVDLMYPNEDTVMKEFLQGLAKRGTSYALAINPENAANRSITLSKLKPSLPTGVAETHKNAPQHIVFEIIQEGKKAIKRAQVSRIPKDVKQALEDVVGGGLLKDSAYQACIRYLSTRWQRQMDYEERSEYDEGTGILSEEQLQRKIEKILGVDRDDVTEQGDVKLGRAIDSLMSSSSVLKALHEQNENKHPGGKHALADGGGAGGLPRPKFPKAGSVSSSKSASSGGLPKKSPGYF